MSGNARSDDIESAFHPKTDIARRGWKVRSGATSRHRATKNPGVGAFSSRATFRPPPAKISPGRPAPAMGPGVGTISAVSSNGTEGPQFWGLHTATLEISPTSSQSGIDLLLGGGRAHLVAEHSCAWQTEPSRCSPRRALPWRKSIPRRAQVRCDQFALSHDKTRVGVDTRGGISSGRQFAISARGGRSVRAVARRDCMPACGLRAEPAAAGRGECACEAAASATAPHRAAA